MEEVMKKKKKIEQNSIDPQINPIVHQPQLASHRVSSTILSSV